MKYHKNTKRNTTKTPNEIPQKYQTKYHKNIKRKSIGTKMLSILYYPVQIAQDFGIRPYFAIKDFGIRV